MPLRSPYKINRKSHSCNPWTVSHSNRLADIANWNAAHRKARKVTRHHAFTYLSYDREHAMQFYIIWHTYLTSQMTSYIKYSDVTLPESPSTNKDIHQQRRRVRVWACSASNKKKSVHIYAVHHRKIQPYVSDSIRNRHSALPIQ